MYRNKVLDARPTVDRESWCDGKMKLFGYQVDGVSQAPDRNMLGLLLFD